MTPERRAFLMRLGMPIVVDPVPVIMDDEIIHTAEHPFCTDGTCLCHADSDLRKEYLEEPLFAGLISFDEAVRRYSGK